MMLNQSSLFILMIICILISCDNATTTLLDKQMEGQSNEQLIEYFNGFNPQWQKAVQSDNADYIIAQYDENAIMSVPNRDNIIGIDAITEYWNQTVQFLDDFKYETHRIGGNPNDILYESGISVVTYSIAQKMQTDTSKYLFVWEYQGNKKYKVLAEMFTK